MKVVHADGQKAILYLRVSTEEQVDNFSLDTQEELCRKEAEKRGYQVTQVFREEGRSAKNISGRPILISLLEYCRKHKREVQALFVYRLDRVSRITADYLAIRKKLGEQDVTIVSATEPTGDSPTEKLVETILAGFAQLDNDIRSQEWSTSQVFVRQDRHGSSTLRLHRPRWLCSQRSQKLGVNDQVLEPDGYWHQEFA